MKDNATMDIRYLDIDQNLPISSVWTMMEDSKGHLWFGTLGGGASRYDGHSFTHFTELEGLSGNHVFAMLEDSRGNLWFGTRSGGVCRYDGHSFTHFTTEEGLAHDFVLCMLEDSKGDIWIGTRGGVSRYDGTHFTHITSREGLAYDEVISLFEDSRHNIWIGTGEGTGLHRYDGNSITHFNLAESKGQNDVHAMIEDRQGNLWFGTWGGGLIRYDGTHFVKFTTAEGLNGNTVLSILEDTDGTLWIGGIGSGVSHYTGTHFIHYTAAEGLSSDHVRYILKDSKDYLWACTWDTGINRINPKGFVHFSTDEGLPQNRVISILKDRTGALWFTGGEEGVSSYDGQDFIHYSSPPESVIGLDASTVYEDRQGYLWFGTGNGVSRFDKVSYTEFTPKEGFSPSDVRAILEDSKGNLWFGTQGGGLNRYDGKTMTHFTEEVGFISDDVFSILEDSQGNLWFGTLGGGVSRFDGNHFTHFTTKEGLSNNYVRAIQEDKQGNLWFGTEGGLTRFDGTEFTRYTTADGLIDNFVFAILIDNLQNVWATTEKGISVLNLSDDHVGKGDYLEGIPFGQFFNFEKEDGLKKANFSSGDIALDAQNKIWFGCKNGLKMLDLNDFEIPAAPPEPVKLSYIEINDHFLDYRQLADNKNSPDEKIAKEAFDSVAPFYNYPQDLTLPYGQNHLTFHFSAIDWTAPHKIRYAYKMEGLEKEWSNPSAEAKADYRNLPYGSFTFKVKAIGEAQVWSEPFEYTFTILPPWWHTWWAYGLYALLAFGASGWYVQRLRRKIREKQQQLEREHSLNVQLASSNRQLAFTNKQLEDTNIANSRFVPNDFLQLLGKKSITDLQLGDQTAAKMTILFADIRSYTTLSETMTPEDNFNFINGFLGRMGPIIKEHGGFINQYFGDGIMALFKDKPEMALKAAIEMQQALERYNKKRSVQNRKAVRLGIGLNTGRLMLGVIGDQGRYESTVISDAVNTASRMEGLTKIFGCSIIISEKTLAEIHLLDSKEVSEAFQNEYRYLGKVKVKGKDQALKIYDFYRGDSEYVRQMKSQTKVDFERAIQYYYKKKFGKAADIFKEIAKKFPEDIATEYYQEKSVEYVVKGVAADWSGIEEMVSK